jgi:hypothetical protein
LGTELCISICETELNYIRIYACFLGCLFLHRIRFGDYCRPGGSARCGLRPSRGPLGKHTLVKRHTDCVHLIDGTVEICFEISVCAQRLSNMTGAAMLRVELDRLEVVYVICRENRGLIQWLWTVRAPRQYEPGLKNI